MTAAERGVVLLCCPLGDKKAKPLTMAQFRELGQRVRAAGRQGNPDDAVGPELLRRLGYSEAMTERIVYLLSRQAWMDEYLEDAFEIGVYAVTRISPDYPRVLIRKRGASRPPVFFCAGNEQLFQGPLLSVAGARDASPRSLAFARQVGIFAAQTGRTIVTGGAAGVDWAAAEGCLQEGGSAVAMIADSLFDRCHLGTRNHLLCSEGGYEMHFTTARAMMRNGYIHQMGDYTVVIQAKLGQGGTWHGAVENLRKHWSPVYIFDDGSPAVHALVAQGATPIRSVMELP